MADLRNACCNNSRDIERRYTRGKQRTGGYTVTIEVEGLPDWKLDERLRREEGPC